MSDITVIVTEAGGSTVSLNVGPAVNYGMPALQVQAGANITVTTTSGTFTIIGQAQAVQSVQGRTGTIALVAADLTAASATHTHSAAQVTGLAGVATSGSYTSLTNIPTLFQPATHTHSAVDISPIVTSVQGRTGTVTLTVTDLTAAAASHTHAYAAVSHTHDTASITGLVFPVTQVQGRTGNVTLTVTDISAASATHTHNFITGDTQVTAVVVLTQSAFSSITSPNTATLYFIT